jgi:hypothetical protein
MLRILLTLIGCLVPGLLPAQQSPGGVAVPPGWRLEHAEMVRGSLGWRDNVMLSPFAEVARAFVRGEAESFVSVKRGDLRLITLVSGDVLRYLSPPAETPGEQQWFAHLEGRWQPAPAWRVALKADAFLQDLVSDLSETEAVRTVLATRVRGALVTLAPRVELPWGFALEPFAQAKRVVYSAVPGDYDESRLGARLEWSSDRRFTLALLAVAQDRRYASRQQHTAGGRPLAGTLLRFRQEEWSLRAGTQWGAAGEWRASLAAGEARVRDGASGFFDHDQRHVRLEGGWRAGPWRLQLEAEARRTDYLIQTVGAGIAPPPRIADGHGSRLRTERALRVGWAAFAEFSWERVRSNEREFSYRAHGVLGGLQREF